MIYAYESFLVMIIIGAGFIIGTVLLNHNKRVKIPKKSRKE